MLVLQSTITDGFLDWLDAFHCTVIRETSDVLSQEPYVLDRSRIDAALYPDVLTQDLVIQIIWVADVILKQQQA